MRTCFKKLNEQSDDFDWVDIADAISDNDLTKIIKGFYEYAKKFEPDLKLFYKDNYKSPILDKLEKEKINIKEYYSSYDIIFEKSPNHVENIFIQSLIEYLTEAVSNAIDYSKFKNIDVDEIDKLIKEYILEELINRFNLYFLNKDKRTGNYVLCMINNVNEYKKFYIYDTNNENNSFGIKDSDFVSKEHLIEYGKESTGIFGGSLNTNKEIYLYSGYFDNL